MEVTAYSLALAIRLTSISLHPHLRPSPSFIRPLPVGELLLVGRVAFFFEYRLHVLKPFLDVLAKHFLHANEELHYVERVRHVTVEIPGEFGGAAVGCGEQHFAAGIRLEGFFKS